MRIEWFELPEEGRCGSKWWLSSISKVEDAWRWGLISVDGMIAPVTMGF